MKIEFTSEQKEVIDTRDKNILVAAAAGSGKTAVLTERIANRICDKTNPGHIDRMLIVTFTTAAAGEMRDRIGTRLREKLSEDPSNEHLRKQIAILHTAQISTIDSFCLYILKNHFQEIGLDSSFSLGTENQALLKEAAFEEVTEELLQNGDEEFIKLVECYAPKGKFTALWELVDELATKAQSEPYPYDWIDRLLSESGKNPEDMAFMKYIEEYENKMIEQAIRIDREVLEMLTYTPLLKHIEAASYDISFMESFVESDFEGRTRLCNSYAKVGMNYGAKKFDADVAQIKDEAGALIKSARSIIENLGKSFHTQDYDTAMKTVRESLKTTDALLRLTGLYMHRFEEKKREERIIDFSDMEHYALQILVKNEDGVYKPSDVALAYRDYFEEIMVDEYQDSNDVQELILSVISRENEEKGNRFMVGDVKQSLYGFRLAKPQIFIDKYNEYDQNPDRGKKIDLAQNFRSRREVVDSVNAVFDKCMMESVGKIAYTNEARLVFGAKYNEDDRNCKTEFLYFDPRESLSGKKETEAAIVARRIRELVESGFTVHEKDKQRPIKFSDIAILLRSTSGKDYIYKEALKREGIPAYVISKGGYFGATEVQLILNFLNIIDNPRQDMPLLGVMHSSLCGFSESEMAEICIKKGRKRLYDNVVNYATNGREEALRAKTSDFVTMLEEFRKMAVYKTAAEMIGILYERFDYETTVQSLPGGEQRYANVKLLTDTALGFETSGLYNIHDFIGYVEKMRMKEVDMGEANIMDENSDVVRIMTIHKSKGLEYPVCILADTGTDFKGSSGSVMLDDCLGIGGEAFDLEKRTKCDSLIKSAIKCRKTNEDFGEEVRVLYVAMTRAKEKLIITGAVKEDKMPASPDFNGVTLLEANSFAKMIYPIAATRKDVFDLKQVDISVEDEELCTQMSREERKMRLLDNFEPASFEPFVYPHSDLSLLYKKTTVSELKKAAYLEREDGENTLYHDVQRKIPQFIKKSDNEVGGSERGSAYHRVMELMDFVGIYEGDVATNLKNHRQKMVDNLFMEKEADALVSEKKILTFLDTELAHRMSEAAQKEKLYLEQPFVLSVDAPKVNTAFPDDEKVLVQGVIDVYFEEDGELVLMDYKTDRVDSGEELTARYKTQLDYYSEALSRLEKKSVKEILIYSFALEKVIKVN